MRERERERESLEDFHLEMMFVKQGREIEEGKREKIIQTRPMIGRQNVTKKRKKKMFLQELEIRGEREKWIKIKI